MGWFGGVVGGIIGSFCGHPFIGAALGYWLSERKGSKERQEGGSVQQVDMVKELFWCFGHLAKADGHVSQDEIAFCESVISSMSVPQEYVPVVHQAFRAGRDSSEDVASHAGKLRACARELCGGQCIVVLKHFMEAMCALAMADGVVSMEEVVLLHRIERCLGFWDVVDNALGRSGAGYGQDEGGYGEHGGYSANASLAQYYESLGVSPQASNEEVRKAYHREIRKFHPDFLASQEITPEFRAFAEKKSREINGAYEAVCKARGM